MTSVWQYSSKIIKFYEKWLSGYTTLQFSFITDSLPKEEVKSTLQGRLLSDITTVNKFLCMKSDFAGTQLSSTRLWGIHPIKQINSTLPRSLLSDNTTARKFRVMKSYFARTHFGVPVYKGVPTPMKKSHHYTMSRYCLIIKLQENFTVRKVILRAYNTKFPR